MSRTALAVTAAGIPFQNPIVLAAGTAAYGRELDGVVDIGVLGGLVTKAVSLEARSGAASPRVAEFDDGMVNAIGLANPSVEVVRDTELPWLAAHRGPAHISATKSSEEKTDELWAKVSCRRPGEAFECLPSGARHRICPVAEKVFTKAELFREGFTWGTGYDVSLTPQ